MMKSGTLSSAFVPRDLGKPTTIVALPLDGSAPLHFTHPKDVYFVHVVNSYENASALIMDVVTYDDNPFVKQVRSRR